MKIHKVIAALAMSATALMASAQTWTVTTKGTIYSGYDDTGVFGTAGQDLSGMSFTQSVTISIDPAAWQQSGSITPWNQYLSGTGPAFTDTVTVNGHSVTFNITSTTDGYQVSNAGADINGTRGGEYIDSRQYGYTVEGEYFTTDQYVFNDYVSFIGQPNFNQSFAQTLDASYDTLSRFRVAAFGGRSAEFVAGAAAGGGSVTYLRVDISPVPEPATYGLLLGGLGVLTMVHRRRLKQRFRN